MEIRGWDNESCRSVANVSWASGSTNVYRLGKRVLIFREYYFRYISHSYFWILLLFNLNVIKD